MTIRWTQPANDDFLGIVERIAVNNPAAASAVGRKILAAVEQLDDFPFLGRPGATWRKGPRLLPTMRNWKPKPLRSGCLIRRESIFRALQPLLCY